MKTETSHEDEDVPDTKKEVCSITQLPGYRGLGDLEEQIRHLGADETPPRIPDSSEY